MSSQPISFVFLSQSQMELFNSPEYAIYISYQNRMECRYEIKRDTYVEHGEFERTLTHTYI